MGRKKTRISHDYCVECEAPMEKVAYIRPFAKKCDECKNDRNSLNRELKDIHLTLKKKKLPPAEDEMSFADNVIDDDEVIYRKKKYGVTI